jgi:hypothetical protein
MQNILCRRKREWSKKFTVQWRERGSRVNCGCGLCCIHVYSLSKHLPESSKWCPTHCYCSCGEDIQIFPHTDCARFKFETVFVILTMLKKLLQHRIILETLVFILRQIGFLKFQRLKSSCSQEVSTSKINFLRWPEVEPRLRNPALQQTGPKFHVQGVSW